MHLSDDRSHEGEFSGGNGSGPPKQLRWWRILAISAFAFLACGGPGFQQDQLSPEKPEASRQNNRAVKPQAQVTPGGPDRDPAAARDEREKQIIEDSARLLKLASELKTEADKTTLDTLSLGIIRKADEVGKLARGMRKEVEEMGAQQPADAGSVRMR